MPSTSESPAYKAITVLVTPGVKAAFEQMLRTRGITPSAYLRAFITAQLDKVGKRPDQMKHETASESADESVPTDSSPLVKISVSVPPRVKAALERRLRSSGSTPSAYLRATVTTMLEKAGDLAPAAKEAPLADGPRPRVRVGVREGRGGKRVEITVPSSRLEALDRDREALGLSRSGWVARAVDTVLLGRPRLAPKELASIGQLNETLEQWRLALVGLSARSPGTVTIDPDQLALLVSHLGETTATVERVLGEHDRRWILR